RRDAGVVEMYVVIGDRDQGSRVEWVQSLTPFETLQQRFQRDDVRAQGFDPGVLDLFIELRRGQRLIEPRPSTIPRLQLCSRQAGINLDHPRPKEIEGTLVGVGGAFEV